MKCEVCGFGPMHGVTVYRQNSKGEKGRWRCGGHNEAAIDPEVAEVVDSIENLGEAPAQSEDKP